MHYERNVHNKNLNSTMKLSLPSHTTALNTARGIVRLYRDMNAALVSLHI